MELRPKKLPEWGSSPSIELANAELLRQEGEVAPLVVNLITFYNYLRGRIKGNLPSKGEQPSPRNAWLD